MKHHICAGGVMAVEAGLDLFRLADRYPNAPAARGTDTSRQAAEAVKPRVVSLQERVLEILKDGDGMTADEVAGVMEESVLAIRPRVAELHKLGKIADTGERRANESGHKAVVWKAVGETGSGKREGASGSGIRNP